MMLHAPRASFPLLLLAGIIGCERPKADDSVDVHDSADTDTDTDTDDTDTDTDDTADTADVLAPLVTWTNPGHGAVGISTGIRILATFSEAMAPDTVNEENFTLSDGTAAVSGQVSQSGALVIFDTDEPLQTDTRYTATLTTGNTDMAGNPLAEAFQWTFTTIAAPETSAPTVTLTSPLDGAVAVALDAAINATFSEDMDPASIGAASFELTLPDTSLVSGAVSYDARGRIGTFAPDEALLADTLYTATITVAATDLAGTAIEEAYVWTFVTGAVPSGLVAVDLGSLSTFVAVAGAGLTNSNSSGITTLDGDVGLSPTGTCLGDGSPCTLTNPVVTGTMYINDAGGIAAQAKVDLTAAYVDAMARPPGRTVNDVSGLVLEPGVYTSGSTMSMAVNGVLVLDGRGDANAVWIFQVGSSLTVNDGAEVLLINGAQAENVYWGVFASSTLGSNVDFQGSVLAGASNSVGTDSAVVGRLLCTTGAITLLSNTITLP